MNSFEIYILNKQIFSIGIQ